MVDQLRSFAAEVTRVAKEVGTDGRLGGQAEVEDVSGTWRGLTESVNSMAANLTEQVRGIATVTTAVANGDLSKKITVEAKGEVAALAETINTMVDQLRSFAAEVTRVAREVGTEGKLGGQAQVEGVSGTWRSLTESVNSMADNLTDQVRNIAQVATAVAQGDLSQKITVGARGEILELKDTINTMVDQLGSFADEVTRVAREVGTDGSLGGQAEVEGVRGRWRDLTENVNQLASTLTTQLRAIAEVSTAVTQGDLTRSITVEAQGEVAELKDNINQMIANLRETTQINVEQDWLKTNLARMGGMLQGQADLGQVTRLIMSELTPLVTSQHGAFFLVEGEDEPDLRLVASYGRASGASAGERDRFALGEGLVGQAAVEAKPILVEDVPEDYIKVESGLGEAAPRNIIVLPVVFEEQVLGVIELASLQAVSEINRAFLEQITETIGVVLNTIRANMRDRAAAGPVPIAGPRAAGQERRDRVGPRRPGGEGHAAGVVLQVQVGVPGQHEPRAAHAAELAADPVAPAGRQRRRQPVDQQVEFATTIHSAGNDLLALINDILDLSKVEAGKMELDLGAVALADICEDVERSFRPVAEEKGLTFAIELDDALPASIVTDEQRLQQVLRNLLSNAFKFTPTGHRERSRSCATPTSGSRSRSPTPASASRPTSSRRSSRPSSRPTARRRASTAARAWACRSAARSRACSAARSASRRASATGRASRSSCRWPIARAATAHAARRAAPSRRWPRPPRRPRSPRRCCPTTASRTTAARSSPATASCSSSPTTPATRRARWRSRASTASRGWSRGARRSGSRSPASTGPTPSLVFAGDGRGERLLGQLKSHPETRHRPVVVAGPAGGRLAALRAGAAAYVDEAEARGAGGGTAALAALDALERLSARRVKRLAIVQEGDGLDVDTLELLGAGDDVDVMVLRSRGCCRASAHRWDRLRGARDPPGRQVAARPPARRSKPRACGASCRSSCTFPTRSRPRSGSRWRPPPRGLVVANAASAERLIDETALYLHRLETQLPQPTRKLLAKLRTADQVFHGKRVLIVDDDIRNVFALASVLETRGHEGAPSPRTAARASSGCASSPTPTWCCWM